MLKARKDGVTIKIQDEQKDEYLKNGYSIADMQGNIIFSATPKGKKQRIAELEAENEALRAEIEALRGNSSGNKEKADSGEENAVATEGEAANKSNKQGSRAKKA